MILPNLYQHNIQDSSQHFIYVFLLLTIGPTLYNWPVLEEVLTCCFSASCKIETKHRHLSEVRVLAVKRNHSQSVQLGCHRAEVPGQGCQVQAVQVDQLQAGRPRQVGEEVGDSGAAQHSGNRVLEQEQNIKNKYNFPENCAMHIKLLIFW